MARARRTGVESRALAMQQAYSEVGNSLFALKRIVEGIETYFSHDSSFFGTDLRFEARDLVYELDAMIRSDEFQKMNENIFHLAKRLKGRS